MTQQTLFHPLDLDGAPIDASFSVEAIDGGFAILFASRGGTKGTPEARNIEYHVGLTILLRRLKSLDATMTDILLDSAAARRRPLTERRLSLPIKFSLPVALGGIEDPDVFRRVLSDAQKDVLVAPGRDAKHGNRMRSIRISFHLPARRAWMDLHEIARFLVGEDAVRPTSDPVELRKRASRLEEYGLVSKPKGNQSPAVVEGPGARRYNRLPSVAAYVLRRANGHCELCGQATFVTDHGEIYLEVHHVVQLAAGGPDTPENTVAVCPNCHRELHFGVDRQPRIDSLYEQVPELVRIVGTHDLAA